MARRAILIANQEFTTDENIARLQSPVADARELAQVLHELGRFYPDVLLENRDHAQVRRTIGKELVEARGNDDLLIFFSGHGFLSEHDGLYLALSDTEEDLAYATGLDVAWLKRAVENSSAKLVVVILDCCFAAAAGAKGPPLIEALKTATTSAGRVWIAASSKRQQAKERELGGRVRSVFTAKLIEGIRTGNADANNDGKIDVVELLDYCRREMKQMGAKQNPQLEMNVESPVVIAHVALTRPPPESRYFVLVKGKTIIEGGYDLRPGPNVLGRGVGCDIRVTHDDTSVSRQHAEIVIGDNETATLHVLTAREGTTLHNDSALAHQDKVRLTHGDRVRLGHTITVAFHDKLKSKAAETTVFPAVLESTFDFDDEPTGPVAAFIAPRRGNKKTT